MAHDASRDWDPQSNPCEAWAATVFFPKGKWGQLAHAYSERCYQELQVKTRTRISIQILETEPAVTVCAQLSPTLKEMLANGIFFTPYSYKASQLFIWMCLLIRQFFNLLVIVLCLILWISEFIS